MSESQNTKADIPIMDVLRQLSSHFAQPVQNDDTEDFLVKHKDFQITSLEGLRVNPRRVREEVSMIDVDSLIDYSKRFVRNGSTVAFVSDTALSVVFDYHAPSSGADPEPAWCEHLAVHKFLLSPEWMEWLARNEKPFDQLALGEFIEDHLEDVVEPTAARLLEIVNRFQETRTATFVSGVQTQNGAVRLQYTEDAKQGDIVIPPDIKLGIKPLRYSERYSLSGKLRYRIENARLKIWYRLQRPDLVLEDATKAVAAKFCEETCIPVFRVTEYKGPRRAQVNVA